MDNSLIEENCESWDLFYEWLTKKGYHVYLYCNIFRNDKFITYFDYMEDGDSGEINETIRKIKETDPLNFR